MGTSHVAGIRAWYYAFCPMVLICTWYTFSRVIRIGVWRIFSCVVHSRVCYTYSHTWYTFSHVICIGDAHSHVWYVFARGAPCSHILRIAQLGIPQQLISVQFGKCDNFPNRFGSDM